MAPFEIGREKNVPHVATDAPLGRDDLSFPPVVSRIIFCEFCERLAYYGIGGNLVLFLQTRLGLSNAEADVQYSIWTSACYVMPLVGGYIADTRLGRYATIKIFLCIYVLGVILTVGAAYPTSEGGSSKNVLMYVGLYIIAVGTGGIKPNVVTLGADQVDGLIDDFGEDISNPIQQDPKTSTDRAAGGRGRPFEYHVVTSDVSRHSRVGEDSTDVIISVPSRRQQIATLKQSYFLWFYWAINVGALIAYTGISDVCQFGINGERSMAFFWGFMVPLIAMCAALWIFVGARDQLLRNAGPDKSKMDSLLGIVREATWRGLGRLVSRTVRIAASEQQSDNNQGSQTKDGVAMDASVNNPDPAPASSQGQLGFLDLAMISHGGSFTKSQVDGVKLLFKLLPFLSVMVLFWCVYSQLSVGFQNQACQMSLGIGSGASIPISSLNLFDTLAVLLMAPILDKYVFPWLDKRGWALTSIHKVQIGLFFSLLSMVTAGFVEQARRAQAQTSLHTAGHLTTAQIARISPCVNINDYSPARYLEYWQEQHNALVMPVPSIGKIPGMAATAPGVGLPTSLYIAVPAYCEQTCNHTYMLPPENGISPGGLTLNSSCIFCKSPPLISDMSVLFQIPQFLLVGLSEVLASVSALEICYAQSPAAFRSVIASLNLLTTALGSFIVIPIIFFVNSIPNDAWITTDLDDGHLDRFFFLLAGLMGLNMLWLRHISKCFPTIA